MGFYRYLGYLGGLVGVVGFLNSATSLGSETATQAAAVSVILLLCSAFAIKTRGK